MYLGIDLGTSSLKILIADTRGKILDSFSKSYPVFENGLEREQNPLDWWETFCFLVAKIGKKYDLKEIKGISFSGQMHGLVLLDQKDNIIRPCILWNDGRTIEECKYLNQKIGKEYLIEHTGNIALEGFTAPKLLYLQKHEKENFERINKIMLPKDYLIYRLTHQFVTDVSDASGTLLFDVAKKVWSKPMLKILSLQEKMLPKVLESPTEVEHPLNDTINALGFSSSLHVIVGGGDQAMNALGTGTIQEGNLSISLGTSGVLYLPLNKYKKDAKGTLHNFCDATTHYHQMAVTLACAQSLKWWMEEILKETDYEKILSEAMKAPKNNIIFLPYLSGERSPIYEPRIRGMFYGLDSSIDRAGLTRAVMEGIAFSLKDCFTRANLEKKKLHARIVGGGSKSESFIQLISNVLGLDIATINTSEGGAFGAILLTMVALHEFPSIEKATKTCIQETKIFVYQEEEFNYYEEKFQEYKKWQKIALDSLEKK